MLSFLKDWCIKFWTQIVEVFTWLLESILSLLDGFFLNVIDTVLDWVIVMIESMDLTEITSLSVLQTWTGMSDQTIWILNYINLPTCITAILAAMTLRFFINFIPATLTRI